MPRRSVPITVVIVISIIIWSSVVTITKALSSTESTSSVTTVNVTKCPKAELIPNRISGIGAVIVSATNDIQVQLTLQDSQHWDCSSGTYVQINIPVEEQSGNNTSAAEIPKRQPPYLLIDHGQVFLVWKDESGQGSHVSYADEFCLEEYNFAYATFKVRTPTCSIKEPCVSKCCPIGHMLTMTGCVKSEGRWKPSMCPDQTKNVSDPSLPCHRPHYRFGTPDCAPSQRFFFKPTHISDQIQLLFDGRLAHYERGEINGNIMARDAFCIDGFLGQNTGYGGTYWDQMVVACSNSEEEDMPWRFPVVVGAMAVSCVFLLATDIVHILLWKNKNLQGWLQFGCSTSFLFAFSSLSIGSMWAQDIMSVDSFGISGKVLCGFMGSLIHFSFLSAFCWLTSMNFDLWWRFGGCKPILIRTLIRSDPADDCIKFLIFLFFSIGFPLIFSITAFSLWFVYRGDPSAAPVLIPSFAKENCYFSGGMEQFLYLQGPIGLLLLVNLLLFISTVVYLRKYHDMTEFARNQSTTSEDRRRVRMFTKLFVVMGIQWICDILSWGAFVMFPDNKKLIRWVSFPTDLFNSLQGVVIFIIFVCKPNIINQLKAKAIRHHRR